MVKKGVFIAIDGLNGSGKTTQASLLTEKLSKDYDVLMTSEPSSGTIGEFIKNTRSTGTPLHTEAEALLLAADRIEHMHNILKPALEQGKIVICDGYVYSSLAYQGSAGLSLDWIKTINARGLQPDIAFFLDTSPHQILSRLELGKSNVPDLHMQDEVREVFLKLVERGDLSLIAGDKPVESISEEIYSTTLNMFELHLKTS
jgi:dTMP kinase